MTKRKTKPISKKLTARFHIALTTKEHELFKKAAKEKKLSVSNYGRKLILNELGIQ